ncbi:MAG: 30S ribosomal protein S8e [Sulfolobales archaeon]
MGVYQGNDFKKITGGKKRPHRKNRKYEIGRFPTNTRISDYEEREIIRVRGGDIKIRLKNALYANILDKKTGSTKKVKIKAVLETPANIELARRGIITKGTIIETELGKAVVTSRPGQDGVINAILMQ